MADGSLRARWREEATDNNSYCTNFVTDKRTGTSNYRSHKEILCRPARYALYYNRNRWTLGAEATTTASQSRYRYRNSWSTMGSYEQQRSAFEILQTSQVFGH